MGAGELDIGDVIDSGIRDRPIDTIDVIHGIHDTEFIALLTKRGMRYITDKPGLPMTSLDRFEWVREAEKIEKPFYRVPEKYPQFEELMMEVAQNNIESFMNQLD